MSKAYIILGLASLLTLITIINSSSVLHHTRTLSQKITNNNITLTKLNEMTKKQETKVITIEKSQQILQETTQKHLLLSSMQNIGKPFEIRISLHQKGSYKEFLEFLTEYCQTTSQLKLCFLELSKEAGVLNITTEFGQKIESRL